MVFRCSNFAEVESCTGNLNQNRSRNLYETASNFGIQDMTIRLFLYGPEVAAVPMA